jgi:hypothetical protein
MATLVPGLARVAIKSTVQGGQAVNNTFYISDGSANIPDLSKLTNLATDLDAFFTTTYRVLLTTNGILQNYTVSQVSDPLDPSPYVQYVKNIALAGTRTEPSSHAPNQLCAVASLKTALVGRRYRGHLFLPPSLDQASISGTGFSSGNYLTAVNNFVAKLVNGTAAPTPTWTGSTLSGWTLAVFSRTAAAAGQNPVFAYCTAVVQNGSIHWLRSRARGTS